MLLSLLASVSSLNLAIDLGSSSGTIFQMEDAKALVMSWHEWGHGALKIYQQPSARPGRAYQVDSTIVDYFRSLRRGEDIIRRASDSGRLLDEQIHILIAAGLEEIPFRSMRSLASAIKYPRTTIWRYLHAVDYTVRHLHLVPQMLTPAQKAERVETAR